MYNKNIPADRELPSSASLVKSTLVAVAGAAFLLVCVVMPAEYGIDPTGIGKMTGLQSMGEIKASLAQEAEAERVVKEEALAAIPAAVSLAEASAPKKLEAYAMNAAVPQQTQTDASPAVVDVPAVRKDTTLISLAPNEGKEIKVDLKKGETVKFVWSSDAGRANFDVHADSKQLNIKYHGYGKGSSKRQEGVIEAAFDGSHGWFWRNRSGAPLTLTLETEGPYAEIKHIN